MVGEALIRRLAADGVRVLATARSLGAERVVRDAGAEPLHTDLAGLGSWAREIAGAEAVFHLGLPRVDPPLRRTGARRRARAAAAGARALAAAAGDRPVVMASTGLLYAARPGRPAVDDDPIATDLALAEAARRAEDVLAGTALRIVRLPWVYGATGLLRDLIVGLRTRRYRIVGPGDNAWALLGAEDAAAALIAAAGVPPGAYTAAEAVPTQREVVEHICRAPGVKRPDHAPPALAGIAMGSAMSRALAASLAIRTGRLAETGWSPTGDWRAALTARAEGSLPIPGR